MVIRGQRPWMVSVRFLQKSPPVTIPGMDIQVSSSLAQIRQNHVKSLNPMVSNHLESHIFHIFPHFFGYPDWVIGDSHFSVLGLPRTSSHHGSKRSRDFALLPRSPAVTWLGSHLRGGPPVRNR